MIKVKNLKKKLIITPIIEEYDFKQTKNGVIIKLKEELLPNTTYTFNFTDAIEDVTEGNASKNVVLAFSTGTYIDSLQLYGRVIDLLTEEPVKEAVVALYIADDTLDIFTGNPRYYTKTDKNGSFFLRNLSNDQFRIYSYLDLNNNLIADTKSEMHGFLLDTLEGEFQEPFNRYDIPLIKLDVSEFKIVSSRPFDNYYDIRLSKPPVDYDLGHLDPTVNSDSLPIISNFIPTSQVIRLFPTFSVQDSLAISVWARDSAYMEITDTVYLHFKESTKDPEKMTQDFDPRDKSKVNPDFKGILEFSKPIISFTRDSILFELDTAYVFEFDSTELKWNKYRTRLELFKIVDHKLIEKIERDREEYLVSLPKDTLSKKKELSPESTDTSKIGSLFEKKLKLFGKGEEASDEDEKPEGYVKKKIPKKGFRIYMAKGAFISIEGDTSKIMDNVYSLKESRNFGIIKGKLNTQEENFLVQLIDKKGEVVEEKLNQKEYQFVDIPPGNYRVRIIIDENKNEMWDAGNILNWKGPERVIFYPDTIPVKKN